MISKPITILLVAAAFVAGTVMANPVAEAVGGWKAAVEDLQSQIDNIQLIPGPPGADGQEGADGINCWDLNGNGMNDASEDINGDGVFDTKDCSGSEVFVIATPTAGDPSAYDITCIQTGFPLGQFIVFELFTGDGTQLVDGAFGAGTFDFMHDYGTQTGQFQLVCIVTDEAGNQIGGSTTITIYA